MVAVEQLISTLGGEDITGFNIKSEFDIIDAIRSGLHTKVIDYVIAEQGLTREEVEELIIPRSTLALRKKRHEPLTLEESEHVVRVARILALAKDTFADSAKAAAWLRKSNRALKSRKPLALLDTEEGARIVETTLGQIAHGLFN